MSSIDRSMQLINRWYTKAYQTMQTNGKTCNKTTNATKKRYETKHTKNKTCNAREWDANGMRGHLGPLWETWRGKLNNAPVQLWLQHSHSTRGRGWSYAQSLATAVYGPMTAQDDDACAHRFCQIESALWPIDGKPMGDRLGAVTNWLRSALCPWPIDCLAKWFKFWNTNSIFQKGIQ